MNDWKLMDGVYTYRENAVEEAKEYQGGDEYSCIDNYTIEKLKAGDILVKLRGSGSGYFTTVDALKASKNNSTSLNEGIQVGPWHNETSGKYTYRDAVEIYKLKNDIEVAQGDTRANTHFGDGGSTQNYIPNFEELKRNGILEQVEDPIPLHHFEITKEQYYSIDRKGKQQVLKRDLQCNLYEKSRLLEMNTAQLSKDQLEKRNEFIQNIDNKINKIERKLFVSQKNIGDVLSPSYDPNITYLEKKIELLEKAELTGNRDEYLKHYDLEREQNSMENSENIMRKVQEEAFRFPDKGQQINVEGLKETYVSNEFRKEINIEQNKNLEDISKNSLQEAAEFKLPKVEGIDNVEHEKVQALCDMHGKFPSEKELKESFSKLDGEIKSIDDKLNTFKQEKVDLKTAEAAFETIDKNQDIYKQYEASGFDKGLFNKDQLDNIANYEKANDNLKSLGIKDKAALSERIESHKDKIENIKPKLEERKESLKSDIKQISDIYGPYEKYKNAAGPEIAKEKALGQESKRELYEAKDISKFGASKGSVNMYQMKDDPKKFFLGQKSGGKVERIGEVKSLKEVKDDFKALGKDNSIGLDKNATISQGKSISI